MPVAFGELIDKLLDARRRLGNDLFPFTPLELDLCIECALEQQLEIRRNRWRFALGALRVATLARLELKLSRRTAGSALVFLGRGVQSHREFAYAGWWCGLAVPRRRDRADARSRCRAMLDPAPPDRSPRVPSRSSCATARATGTGTCTAAVDDAIDAVTVD